MSASTDLACGMVKASQQSYWAMSLLLCWAILASSHGTCAWNLTSLGLDLSVVSHVSVVGTRAILSVPRENELQLYTLVEVSWPDRPKSVPSYARAFPNKVPQTVGDCSLVQSAVTSDWDGFRHLLVLDSGWLQPHNCPPKVLVFDFITNQQIVRCELSGVPRAGLNSLLVDGSRAYIGGVGLGKLIVYEIHSHHWWVVNLVSSSQFGIHFPSASQLALAASSLFMASETSDKLYKLELRSLRLTQNLSNVELQAEMMGELLGPPRGIVTDKQGFLYCVARDYVCLHWDTRLPLLAENHQVLLQSAELLPRVHQLFFDIHRQLWALTDKYNSTYCTRIRRPTPNYLWM